MTVTQKIRKTKQPHGGYLKPKEMIVEKLEEKELYDMSKENYTPAIIGMVIDYLTRYLITKDAKESFRISLMGAENLGMTDLAMSYINELDGLNERSIYAALKLVGFDVAYRVGPMFYNPNYDINKRPNKETISNITTMLKNSLSFFETIGAVVKDGFVFRDLSNPKKNGYSNEVTNGDGDFLTNDTLWDFKVSKKAPTSKNTLQLLMYFIMGKKSQIDYFKNLTNVGIFNPRLNIIYRYDVETMDLNILKTIAKDVIKYNNIKFIDKMFN